MVALFLTGSLVKNFSGRGLVPDTLLQQPAFAIAVASGTALTVLLATRIGMPISNLITSILVSTASFSGLPVSTTHVSVGSLFSIAAANKKIGFPIFRNILLSWVLTLPTAAALAAAVYFVVSKIAG